MDLPAPALRLLHDQQGLVTRRQLTGCGISGPTADDWVRRGELETIERGVYRSPTAGRQPVHRLLAAVLRSGPQARAGGWSACALYGLEGFSLMSRPWIIVPPHTQVRGVSFIVVRSSVDLRDRAVLNGVPAVSATRALVDTAGKTTGRRLRVAVDDARRRNLLTLEKLLEAAAARTRHRGAAEVSRLFGAGAFDQDGEAERWLAAALAQVGMYPLWSAEVLPGIFPDATFPEAGLLIECDGGGSHTLMPDRASDASREALLRSDGWEVLRIRARELKRDPQAALERVLERYRQRCGQGLGRPAGWRPLTPGRRLRP